MSDRGYMMADDRSNGYWPFENVLMIGVDEVDDHCFHYSTYLSEYYSSNPAEFVLVDERCFYLLD